MNIYYEAEFKDPGWPQNPVNGVVCILCKNVLPFVKQDPEQFFRHLITDHCTYFNLNLLLEVSLAQPNAVSEENQADYAENSLHQ